MELFTRLGRKGLCGQGVKCEGKIAGGYGEKKVRTMKWGGGEKHSAFYEGTRKARERARPEGNVHSQERGSRIERITKGMVSEKGDGQALSRIIHFEGSRMPRVP